MLRYSPWPRSHQKSVLPSGDHDGSASRVMLRPGPIAHSGVDAVEGLRVR